MSRTYQETTKPSEIETVLVSNLISFALRSLGTNRGGKMDDGDFASLDDGDFATFVDVDFAC